MIRTGLVKTKDFGLGMLKYGLSTAKLIKSLDSLMLNNNVYSHKKLLLSILENAIGKNANDVLLSATVAKDQSDLHEISSRIELFNLSTLRFLLLFSTYYGSLISAEYIRQNYLARIVDDKLHNPFFVPDVALSLLEFGDWERAFDFISRKKTHPSRYWSSDIMDFCQYLLDPEEIYPKNNVRDGHHWIKSNLVNPIEECSFLVEGPSVDTPTLDKYDLHDYIVKTNYIPSNYKNLGKYILYYNYRKFSDYALEIANFVNYSGYICLKSETQLSNLCRQALADNARSFTNARSVMFRQHEADPMAIQNILYDLITSGAKNIFLTSVDGYSKTAAYSKEYQLSDPRFSHHKKIDNIARSLRLHDPFANFSFICNLIKSGRISANPSVNEIFMSKRSIYAKRIDAIYGNKHVY